MTRSATLPVILLAAVIMAGCGTSTAGSRYQDTHGVSQDSGYPKGNPTDSGSPALGSSAEKEKSKEGPKTEHPEAEKPHTQK